MLFNNLVCYTSLPLPVAVCLCSVRFVGGIAGLYI